MKAIWRGFSSILADGIQAYLEYKRAIKRKFRTEEMALRLLDRYLMEHRIAALTAITPLVIEDFLASRPRKHPRSYNHLLGVTRCFFAWLVVQGRLECSPVRIRAKRSTGQLQPYLFSPDQAKQLLELAASLPDRPKGPDRGETYYLVFALMYALGLRVSEVVRLRRCDVDLKRQLLEIRQTKFSKDRLVPFGPNVGHRVTEYLERRNTRFEGLSPDDPLFSFNAGRAINPCTISQTFHHLVTDRFQPPPGVAPPRSHCLRHSFAVGTLLRWYRSGIDPNTRLIHLSTFLGHVDPVSTAWYLTITAELLDEANTRFEQFAAPAIAECVL
jgi:site-specific recombinase XerD